MKLACKKRSSWYLTFPWILVMLLTSYQSSRTCYWYLTFQLTSTTLLTSYSKQLHLLLILDFPLDLTFYWLLIQSNYTCHWYWLSLWLLQLCYLLLKASALVIDTDFPFDSCIHLSAICFRSATVKFRASPLVPVTVKHKNNTHFNTFYM